MGDSEDEMSAALLPIKPVPRVAIIMGLDILEISIQAENLSLIPCNNLCFRPMITYPPIDLLKFAVYFQS